MNDSDIIKALECCMKAECQNCPMYVKENQSCMGIQIFDVVVLINRQKAEIDRLNIDLKAMRGAANSWKAEVQRICKKEFDNIEIDIEAVKSEAVREFAEKLKPMLSFGRYTSYEQIDNLVKEMGCNDG